MLEVILSFLGMFLIGCAGAGVFLLVFLLAAKDIVILRNNVINDLHVMAILYILAGGLVAAVIQISSGLTLQIAHFQTVFMLGFGWQGVFAGIGATGYVKQISEKFNENISDIQDIVEIKEREKEQAIKHLKEKLASLTSVT